MARNMNWKSWVILGLAVTILVTSGGLVMASNMGFKINKQIFPGFLTAASPKRVNWISLPYSNPYPNAKTLCTAMGSSVSTTVVFQLNPTTGGSLVNFPCNLPTTPALDATRGVRVTTTTGTPANAVLVGSSNEAATLPTILGSFVASGAPKKDNWISVPYHTTWLKAEDICVTLGIGAGGGSAIRINADPAATANTVTHPCGNTAVSNFSLVIGEAVLVRKTSAGDIAAKLPPHF